MNIVIGNYILRKPVRNIKVRRLNLDSTFIGNLIILNKQT